MSAHDDPSPTPIDAYIAAFPPAIQERLAAIRAVIQATAPDAAETISYAMPTFTLHGNLIHFAAFKHHIGLYPTPSGIEVFAAELAAYKNAKGSVQFPHDQPLPLDLIRRITLYRVEENRQRAASQPKRQRKPKAG
jgi:uncharacterized protein YdhG (YjbR/CyaY superfamily)